MSNDEKHERADLVYQKTRADLMRALWSALGCREQKARDILNAIDNMLTARLELERQRNGDG